MSKEGRKEKEHVFPNHHGRNRICPLMCEISKPRNPLKEREKEGGKGKEKKVAYKKEKEKKREGSGSASIGRNARLLPRCFCKNLHPLSRSLAQQFSTHA